MSTAQNAPGPWEVIPGRGRGSYRVSRLSVRTTQYLGANGKPKMAPSTFRSEAAARAAIAKAQSGSTQGDAS